MERDQNTRQKNVKYELGLRSKGYITKPFDCSWMETGLSDILGYVGFNIDKHWSMHALSFKVFRSIQIEL